MGGALANDRRAKRGIEQGQLLYQLISGIGPELPIGYKGRKNMMHEWQERLLANFGKIANIQLPVPHFISQFRWEYVDILAHVLQAPLGVWPESLWIRKGKEERFVTHKANLFIEWQSYKNQQELHDFCDGKRGTYGAIVLLKSTLSDDSLNILDESLQGHSPHFLEDTEFILELFLNNIALVDCVSLVLDLERRDYIVTLVNPPNLEMYNAMRNDLERNGIGTFTLEDVYQSCRCCPPSRNHSLTIRLNE